MLEHPRSAVDRLALTCAAATGARPRGRKDRLADEVGAISDACVAANMSIAPPFCVSRVAKCRCLRIRGNIS
jgi:hypothetical protein